MVRTYCPSWLLCVALFVFGYPSIWACVALSEQSDGTLMVLPPDPAAAFVFALFAWQGGAGAALSPFIVGIVIGTLYYATFQIGTDFGLRAVSPRKHAVVFGFVSGIGMSYLAYQIQGALVPAFSHFSTVQLGLLLLLGAALGALGPAVTVGEVVE